MKKTIIILSVCLIPAFGFSQIKLYGEDGKVSVSAEQIEVTSTGRFNQPAAAAAIAALAPTVLKTSIDIAKYALSKKEEKFSADYKGRYGASDFYLASKAVNLQDLRFSRQYKRESNISGPWQDGLIANFSAELNDDANAFRYRLDDLQLNYSKAKAKPDDPLDIQFEIKFSAFAFNDGKAEVTEIATQSVEVKGMSLGENRVTLTQTHYTDWFPIPDFGLNIAVSRTTPFDSAAMVGEAVARGLTVEEALKNGWMNDGANNALKYLKIDDTNYFRIDGTYQVGGTYSLEVSVKEANPRVIKTQKLKEFLEENDDSLNSLGEKLIEVLFSDNDEEDEEG